MCAVPAQLKPLFSVVVPTFRRPQALAALLKGISGMRFPHCQMEVIVVDDSGCGGLEAILAPFRQCFPVHVLPTPHLGPAPARQAGIDLAQGEYLVFTDDDCVPDADWLTQLQAAMKANPECAIGGAVHNGLPDNIFAAASQLIYDYVVRQSSVTEVEYVGTGNAAYPAGAFRAIGGMDRNWAIWGGEDRDLCRRWRGSGRRFVFHPGAKIHHYHPLTLRTFWNQQFRYGRGASRYHRTSSLERWQFYSGLIAAGFRGDACHYRPFLGALVLLSQIATGSGFLVERLFGHRA